MRPWSVLPAALIALSLGPLDAGAQKRSFPLHLAPTLGWYKPTQDLKRVPGEASADWTRIASAPMAGLTAELGLPIPALSLRGGVMYVNSDLAARRFAGFESCGSNCEKATYRTDPVAGSQIYIAVADVLLRGPLLGPVQPYIVGGGGVKRYNFAQGELSDGYEVEYARDVTQRTSHVGIGTDVRLGGQLIAVEVSDYVSGFRSAAAPGATGSAALGGKRQHDISVTIGLRIGIR
jgi:hypothetical protein